MSIRIVVADEASALFYDIPGHDVPRRLRSPLHVCGQVIDPTAHLHDRDLVSDQPGRKSDRAPLQGGRRGATAHHATGGERHARSHQTQQFVHRIAEALAEAVHDGTVDRLILVCAPHFLGLLRAELPSSLSSLIIDEVHKDLSHQPESALRAHLTGEIAAGRLSLVSA